MPTVTAKKTTSAPARRTTRAPKKAAVAAAPAFQEPLADMPEPATEPVPNPETTEARPVEHDGLKIEKEILLSNLPSRAPFKISKLLLIDGNTAYACRDCLYTAYSRGDVMVHRNNEHGSRYGRKSKVHMRTLRAAPDPVLPPRDENTPAPSNPMKWTLEEFLAVAPDLAALGDHCDRLETENEQLREQAHTSKVDQHKIDVYETLQGELVEARVKLNQQADYDRLKEEVIALRAFKRNVTKKLAAVGFQLSEEGE